MYFIAIDVVILFEGEGGALPSAAAAWTGAERVVVLLALSSLALGTPGKLLLLEVLHHLALQIALSSLLLSLKLLLLHSQLRTKRLKASLVLSATSMLYSAWVKL
jgi:hypothetical protein